MRKLSILATGGAAVLTALAGTAFAVPAQADEQRIPSTTTAAVPIDVSVVAAGGTGCKKSEDNNNVEVTSVGNGAVLLTYPTMTAKATGAKQSDYKNCVASLAIDVPEGYTWSLAALAVKGRAHVDDGSLGRVNVTANVSGATGEATVVSELEGPYSGPFVEFGNTEGDAEQPCGQKQLLNINAAAIAAKRSGGFSTVQLRSANAEDGSVLISLTTRECNPQD